MGLAVTGVNACKILTLLLCGAADAASHTSRAGTCARVPRLVACHRYVAVASDACNVEFGLLQQLAHEAIRESQQEGHGNDADEASNESHLFPRKSGGSVTMSDRPYDV